MRNNLLWFLLIISGIHVSAHAEEVIVAPGETGNLTMVVKSDGDSPIPIEQVLVTLSGAPSFFHAPASIGPINILAGEIKNFVFPYSIDSTAPDGQFLINLKIIPQGTPNSTPISPDTSWDTSVDFMIDGGDVTGPQIALYNEGRGATVPPISTPENAIWLVGLSTPVFSLSDPDSGLSMMVLSDDDGEMISWDFYDGAPSAEVQISIPQDKTGYVLLVGDTAGNESRMYFHVDRKEPKVEYLSVNVKLNDGFYMVDAYVSATDDTSGISAGPVKLVNPPLEGDLGVHNPGPTYPEGPLVSISTYTDLIDDGPGRYMFLAADKADNLGANELWLDDVEQTINITSLDWYVEQLNNGLPPPNDVIVHEGLVHLNGVASGRRVNNASFSFIPPEQPSDCSVTPPVGMEITLSGGAYTPDESESVDNEWDNIPLHLDYPLSTSPSITIPVNGMQSGTIGLDWKLPQYAALNISIDADTDMSVSCPGMPTVTIPTNLANYGMAASVETAWTMIISPRVIHQEWVAPAFNVSVHAGILEVGLDRITAPGKITISRAHYDPQIPGYRPIGDVYDISIGAAYEGSVHVTFYLDMSGLTAAQKQGIAIFHNTASGWQKENTEIGVNQVTYVGATASPFVVLVPIDDTLAPETALIFSGGYAVIGGATYVSSTTMVQLSAVDAAATPSDISGPATTYYLVDVAPTAECFATTFDPNAPRGTCANPVYKNPFSLAEGVHLLSYFTVDKAGNYEVLKSTPLYSDGTAPVPALYSGGIALMAGTTAYLTAGDSVAISTRDPVSGGVVSGLGVRYYLVDTSVESCGGIASVVSTAPAGTCPNPVYGGPFSLSPGTHTVYYSAVDKVGNMAPIRRVFFNVSSALPVFTITPSSGPIGGPFTIEGTGFGTYSAGTTVVLLGGTTAPLTLWTDTKIQGTIPGALAAGQYPVVVKRGAEVLAEVSPFTVTQPALYTLTPSSGAIGIPFSVTGESFGNYVAGYTRVLVGGATMPLTLWTDTQIKGTIPGTLPAGDYELLVERALNGGVVRTSTATFSLRNMEAWWLAPSSGPIGMPFTITGAGFGNYTLPYTSVLIGDTTAPLTLWTDSKIQGTVPGGLASGQHPVLVERRTSDGGLMQTSPMTFEVVNVDVASMTPVAGPIGLPFTIYGAGFGNYSAGYTKVLLGGTTCPLTLWTDTQIKGTIPGSLAPGEYPVVVERTLNGGQAQSAPLVFTVAAPEAYSLSPSSGPIGLPFTITGGNFGNYVANYTKVLIGGATAPLTLWTDTQIKGTIPGSLAAGDHELIVERALNGGVVHTSTFTFTVGTPYLDTVSPSTASVVAPFTITGYNFGNYVANYTKVLIGGATTALTLWTDTKIQGKLPYLPAGSYPVQVQRYLNGGLAESATAYIGVEEPVVSSMTPASGAVGTVFNLYGTGFGPYESAIAKVFIGGAQCALSLWTDTRITGTVPTALSYGTHTVVAARGQALANALEFYIPGGYTPSMMRLGTTPSALEFKLGEVYVYPDPAKGGKVPTFHIEVGTADSVKLKIYTVAGQLAHEATLTGSPQAVGSVYAYEYAWTGRIASGVYYYTIEAEKGGKKLKAKGKFAVIR